MEWISVNDKLPEPAELVLVYSEFRGVRLFSWDTELYVLKPSLAWGKENMEYRITHWMPLPEPPKIENL